VLTCGVHVTVHVQLKMCVYSGVLRWILFKLAAYMWLYVSYVVYKFHPFVNTLAIFY
jgi:hypothetical protein